jgi:hypothetical protein
MIRGELESSRRLPRRGIPELARPLVAVLALAFCTTSGAVDSDDGSESRAAHVRIDFEHVKFPGNERVGLIGSSYLVDVGSDGWSLGPSLYGAATGRRGGFFTFGGEASWRRHLGGPLAVEVGLYAGGGGGSGAPQGGGLMLRPHVDVLWEFADFALGVSLAKVKFPSGQIDSTQWGVVLSKETNFNFVPARGLEAPVSASGRTGVGFDRVQAVASSYRTRSGSMLLDGAAAPRNIFLIGARAEQALGGNAFWGLEASGAATSTVSGYAEYLASLGIEAEVIEHRLSVGARAALGIGGGGGIAVGGGAIAKAALYSIIRLNDDLGIALEAGLMSAPGGELRATTLSATAFWLLDSPGGHALALRPVRTDFSAGVERFNAARRDGSSGVVTADVLKVDRFLTPHLYLSGQVDSAIAGGAGGYSAALLGAGWAQPVGSRGRLSAELLAGASGGGGVDSHGAIFQAMAHASFQLSPALALSVGGGRVEALRGPFGANVASLSLTVTYGVSGP